MGDSTVVVDTLDLSGSHFSADIPANGEDGIYNVMFAGNVNFRFAASPNDTLKFDINITPTFLHYTVEGNEYSKLLQEQQVLMGNTISVLDSLDGINKMYRDSANFEEVRMGLNQVYQSTMINHRQALIDMVNDDSTNLTNIFVIYHQVGNSPVLNPSTDIDIFYRIDNGVFSRYPDHPIAKTYHNSIQKFRENVARQRAAQQARMSIQEGALAPSITLKDPFGEERALKDLRGKVVLIDFWASWCMPCRQNNPHLVSMYNKYKNKGFDIYSVSLDGLPNQRGLPREDWRNAIQQDGLIWPNHVSDLKGWDSEVVTSYGIEGIPFTVLIDREGYILGTNLRGEALEQKLEIYLGN
ncbi:MAG: TlpA family protein disulfide reductase [Bacteroidetes bacterium]|nr:MAG: TlpA family protein disulfide reductase [Bacteroidota bacterium]